MEHHYPTRMTRHQPVQPRYSVRPRTHSHPSVSASAYSNQPRYAVDHRNRNLQSQSSASGSAYSNPSSSLGPYYFPQHVVSYGHDVWKAVTISHGDNIYRCYQRINTYPVQPHQLHLPPIPSSWSYNHPHQQHLPPALLSSYGISHQERMPLIPPPSPYGHQFENLHQYQNSFSVGAINQQLIRSIISVRYLSFDDFEDEQNSRAIDMNLPFHIEDDVMVLHRFPPPSLDEIRLATQYIRNSGAPVSDDISDETIEANLNIKIYDSSANPSSEASSSDHDMCVVCQAEYENNEEIGTLQCGHQYHIECIKKWLKKKNLCPICKAAAL